MRRLALAGLAVLLLAPAGPARAGGTVSSPFSLGVPQSAPTVTTTAPTVISPATPTSTSTTSGFSALDAVLVAAGVALVIAAIAGYVWRDARSAARGLRHAGLTGSGVATGVRPGSKAAPRARTLSAQEKRRRKRGRAPRRR